LEKAVPRRSARKRAASDPLENVRKVMNDCKQHPTNKNRCRWIQALLDVGQFQKRSGNATHASKVVLSDVVTMEKVERERDAVCRTGCAEYLKREQHNLIRVSEPE
jgi:hypothetical protein